MAMEDNRTDPDDKSLMVPMTEIDDALLAVTNQIFPYRALKTQKQWMSKYMRKPYEMAVGAKQFVTLMSQIINYIPFFSNATVLSKIFQGRATQYLGIRCTAPLEESL
jgi:hypothetical protein